MSTNWINTEISDRMLEVCDIVDEETQLVYEQFIQKLRKIKMPKDIFLQLEDIFNDNKRQCIELSYNIGFKDGVNVRGLNNGKDNK